jgi:A/G-specific adenine glycosylase
VIAPRLLAWFDRHGRHGLPWQLDRNAYSIWVSEIMLQQTQVATVIPYYTRFMQRFPSVEALAAAPLDAVLAHWSGLGYYARARNLHRAAQLVVESFGGRVPKSLDGLMTLPGIGRSTAGAILAQAYGERWPILDGNVKRVLARYHAVEGWPGEPAVERALWAHAEAHTPHERIADYTQAIMDLGATLCTRTRPACTVCPLAADCRAARDGAQAAFPSPRPMRSRPQRRVAVVVVRDSAGRVLLERRPARGVWGGLHSLPELDADDAATDWCGRHLGAAVVSAEELATIEHAFTHFDLDLAPCVVRIAGTSAVKERDDWFWHTPGTELPIGVPAPIAALLSSLAAGPTAR